MQVAKYFVVEVLLFRFCNVLTVITPWKFLELCQSVQKSKQLVAYEQYPHVSYY